MKRKVLILLMSLCLLGAQTQAAPNPNNNGHHAGGGNSGNGGGNGGNSEDLPADPGGDPDTEPATQVPLDNGVWLLIAAAVFYGLYINGKENHALFAKKRKQGAAVR